MMQTVTADPQLDLLSREELVERARALGARRPEVMTRVELRDEIVRLSESDPLVRRRSRGWLGVARDLVASVVDSGLNLPGAAAAIRGEAKPENEWRGPPPVATLTLAEIYLAQGHVDRALAVVHEVLASEPDHSAAQALRDRLTQSPTSRRRVELAPEPEPDVEPDHDIEPVTVVSAPEPAPALFTFTPEPESAPVPEPEPAPEPVFSAPEPEPTPEPVLSEPAPAEPAPVPEPVFPPDEPGREPAFVSSIREPASAPPASVAPPRCLLFFSEQSARAHFELPPALPNPILRLVWFVPHGSTPERHDLDVPVPATHAPVALPEIPLTASVRAAVGSASDEGFTPLAVAWVYRKIGRSVETLFAPPGEEPISLRESARERAD